jgi:hypothetical protein
VNGCNVENAAYPVGVCAEMTVIAKAVVCFFFFRYFSFFKVSRDVWLGREYILMERCNKNFSLVFHED